MQRYRITLGGALFGPLLVVTGLAAFLTGNNLLFLIFSAMLALLLVSGFLNRLVLSGLELELLLPEHICARAPVAARLRLRNMKHFTPSFSIELSGRGGGASLRNPVYIPLIPGGGVVEAPVEMTFERRGLQRENVFVLASRFPFGFIQRATFVALSRETLVYPALSANPQLETMVEGTEEEAAARGTGTDFYRIRAYLTTDSARLVDWKSTAHTGELQVREFAREERAPVEIYLDRRAGFDDAAAFETMLEECAWLVWQLSGRGLEIRFESSDRALSDTFDILRYLAVTQPLASDSEAEMPKGDAIVFRVVKGPAQPASAPGAI